MSNIVSKAVLNVTPRAFASVASRAHSNRIESNTSKWASGCAAVGHGDQLTLEIEIARARLRFHRTHEEPLLGDRVEAGLDFMVELADGSEVDLERLRFAPPVFGRRARQCGPDPRAERLELLLTSPSRMPSSGIS
ncbi:MAG: hypothetical protein ABI346_01505 [Candidatus Baltobacteraceae bacterium]